MKKIVKNIAEYLEEVLHIKDKWPNSNLAFRGQEDAKWPLESSAERRLNLKENFSREKDRIAQFQQYNAGLIKQCKLKNYDKREQMRLGALELLADLQHHGAATCLIDFTRSALVALWFACKKANANGKVFVVNTADQKTFSEKTDTEEPIDEVLAVSNFPPRKAENDPLTQATSATPTDQPNFWYWKPAHLNERITAQHSLFIFGLPSPEKLGPEEIIVESENKEQIRTDLKELHDIWEESLFPDFIGFAYTQRSDAPYDIQRSDAPYDIE